MHTNPLIRNVIYWNPMVSTSYFNLLVVFFLPLKSRFSYIFYHCISIESINVHRIFSPFIHLSIRNVNSLNCESAM